jgi:hypothetical protein
MGFGVLTIGPQTFLLSWFVSSYCSTHHEGNKVDMPKSNTTIEFGLLYLSGMWLGVDLRIDTRMICV